MVSSRWRRDEGSEWSSTQHARFFDPSGIELPDVGIPHLVEPRAYEIGAPSPGWDGQRVDYDAAVASLL